MLEETGDVGGGLLEYMMRKVNSDGHYDKQFKKLVKEIKKAGRSDVEAYMS